MAKTVDPTARFSRMRDKSGDLDEQARADMVDLGRHHGEIGWTAEQVDELRADLRDWWRQDAAAARQYLAEAAGEARKFLARMAAAARAAESRVLASRAEERRAA